MQNLLYISFLLEGSMKVRQEHALLLKLTKIIATPDLSADFATHIRSDMLIMNQITTEFERAKKEGIDIRQFLHDNNTLLNMAIETKRPLTFTVLVNNGASLDHIDADTGDTSLILAIKAHEGNIAIKIIEQNPALLNKCNNKGFSPIMLAASTNSDMLKYIFETAGVNSNADLNLANNIGNTALMLAAFYGVGQNVQLLLEHGANPLLKDKSGQTALKYNLLSETRHTDPQGNATIREVIKSKVATLTKLYNSLFSATEEGNLEVVKELIGSGLDPRYQADNGMSVFDYAVRGGHIETAKYLHNLGYVDSVKATNSLAIALAAAANKNRDLDFQMIRFLLAECDATPNNNCYNTCCLVELARMGKTDLIELMIHKGVNIDALGAVNGISYDMTSKRDGTALMAAAKAGHFDAVRLLVAYGANCTLKTKENKTAEDLAREAGYREITDYLYDKRMLDTLRDLVEVGDLSGIKKFFKKRNSEKYANYKNAIGESFLSLAAQRNHLDIVKYFLLQHNANVFEEGYRHQTVSMIAQGAVKKYISEYIVLHNKILDQIKIGNLDAVKEIEARNQINWNYADIAGMTPLMVAAWQGHNDIVEYLLQKKVNVNAQNFADPTALMFAKSNTSILCTAKLMDCGADIFVETNAKMIADAIEAQLGCRSLPVEGVEETKGAEETESVEDSVQAGHVAKVKSRRKKGSRKGRHK